VRNALIAREILAHAAGGRATARSLQSHRREE